MRPLPSQLEEAREQETPVSGLDLLRETLEAADLTGVEFRNCRFRGCQFLGCDLSGASFSGSSPRASARISVR